MHKKDYIVLLLLLALLIAAVVLLGASKASYFEETFFQSQEVVEVSVLLRNYAYPLNQQEMQKVLHLMNKLIPDSEHIKASIHPDPLWEVCLSGGERMYFTIGKNGFMANGFSYRMQKETSVMSAGEELSDLWIEYSKKIRGLDLPYSKESISVEKGVNHVSEENAIFTFYRRITP